MLENIIDADVQSTLPAFVKAHMAHGQVLCDCNRSAVLVGSGSWREWTCAESKCSFAVKADELKPRQRDTPETPQNGLKTATEREEAPLPPSSVPPLLTDDELLHELGELCAFKVEAVKHDTAVAFALYLLNVAPIGAWSPDIAREAWPRFQEIRRAA